MTLKMSMKRMIRSGKQKMVQLSIVSTLRTSIVLVPRPKVTKRTIEQATESLKTTVECQPFRKVSKKIEAIEKGRTCYLISSL